MCIRPKRQAASASAVPMAGSVIAMAAAVAAAAANSKLVILSDAGYNSLASLMLFVISFGKNR